MAYGRSRQSIADIEQELHNIFNNHPQSHANDAGEPVIPADALVDVFRAFSDVYDGVELMTADEMDMLKGLLSANPGLEVTPQILLQFIAEKTKNSPRASPQPPASSSGPSTDEEDDMIFSRPTKAELEAYAMGGHSRSSSNESNGTASEYAQVTTRPSSRTGNAPSSAKMHSPFDASKRQRSTPLSANAPSSWTKPAPAHRRKSDAGSRSDSESFSTGPSSFGRLPRRSRAPSNPTSPSKSNVDLFSPTNSPQRSTSRPHSRSHSQQPQSHFGSSSVYRYPDLHGSPTRRRTPELDDDDFTRTAEYFKSSISSLKMPGLGADDSDSDGEDEVLGLVLDRSTSSSTVSMEPHERLEALQRANTELGKKLVEAEQTLQNKLTEHEFELEEMQSRMEEVRSELSATKREEKELRSKERQNSTQIAALESEIGKLQKSLENARATYSSLQKQYQEQCSESERYRNALRRRDQEIKELQDLSSLHSVETQKWTRERDTYEDRIAHLEQDLAFAQQAHLQLDEQKQENMMLKETIDRMRFDMDELRSAMSSAVAGGSGSNSAVNSVSKSLGAELLGKMKGQWGMEEVGPEDEVESAVVVAGAVASGTGDLDDGELTQVESSTDGGDSTEGEDFIHTIITRKTRKVQNRANRPATTTRTFEVLKEYSDAYTQHDSSGFTSTMVQTDNVVAGSSVQTDEPEVKPVPVPKVTVEMEIQTDEPDSRSSSPQDDEATASSSSTVLPPTPKPKTDLLLHPHSHDLPPAYNEQDREERDWILAADTLKKWHKGTEIPLERVPAGVSEDAVEEWKALKEELGIECIVIDKVISMSDKTGLPRSAMGGERHSTASTSSSSSRKGRFYNIYNTYVYGTGRDGATTFPAQFLLGVGATALMFLAMSPYMVPHYTVPGHPSYYDRTMWHTFNTMQAAGEGFSSDGTAAVWSFIGRVGGGAARIARGFPT